MNLTNAHERRSCFFVSFVAKGKLGAPAKGGLARLIL